MRSSFEDLSSVSWQVRTNLASDVPPQTSDYYDSLLLTITYELTENRARARPGIIPASTLKKTYRAISSMALPHREAKYVGRASTLSPQDTQRVKYQDDLLHSSLLTGMGPHLFQPVTHT